MLADCKKLHLSRVEKKKRANQLIALASTQMDVPIPPPSHLEYDGYGIKPMDIRTQGHYTQFKIQPASFIAANNLGYFEGNVIKYVCRYKLKNGVEDLNKAKHYLDMLLEKVTTGEVKL